MRQLEDFKKLEAEGETIITERRDLRAGEFIILGELRKHPEDPLELIKTCFYSGVAEGYRQAKAEEKAKKSK